MYNWSKEIINKIEGANCLNIKELRMVEVALRMSELHESIMNECIGVSEDNIYELKYKM